MKRDNKTLSIRSRSGFSLVELLVYMVILGLLMALVLTSFTQTLQQSAQQSDIAETQIETRVGLELLRFDLEHAGFGLPWDFKGGTPTYNEPDPLAGASGDVPRALSSQDNAAGLSLNNADYLVIRAINVIPQDGSGQRWGWLGNDSNHLPYKQNLSEEPLADDDWVIALSPGNTTANIARRTLMMNGNTFAFQANLGALAAIAPPPTPSDPDGEKLLLYRIGGGGANINFPFNRTDFFITNAAPNIHPAHCAPNTGVLVKQTLNQTTSNFDPPLPMVDCVADFQVVYVMKGASPYADADELNGMVAGKICDEVREVRCFILLHEGKEDPAYTHPIQNMNVGEVALNGALLAGRPFDLAAIGPNWAHYRWKVVSISASPKNFR